MTPRRSQIDTIGENRATFQAFELIQEMTVKCKSEKGPSAAQMKRLFEEHHDDMLWEVNRAERTQRLEDNLTSAQQNNSEVRENLSSAKTVLYDTQGTHMNVSGNSTSGDQT